MAVLLRAIVIAAVMLCGGARAEEPGKGLSCGPQTVADVDYTVCSIDMKIAQPRLFWKNAEDEPYRAFAEIAKAVAAEGKVLSFAMNAGMYDGDFSPMGLYIEGGKELKPANTFEVKPSGGAVPNFYKKPNGVLFWNERGAGMLPTDLFLKRKAKERAQFATQSGPMLVIDGKVNAIFIAGSTDRKRRSGVGICDGGILRFAISDDPVNFHDFATLFSRELKCANALFLDGGRGAGIYVPALAREDWSGHGGYGPMVGLVE